jgi:hypothetical protein
VEPRGVAEEPISSELALVDEELARRARAALPDPPWLLPALAELQDAEQVELSRSSLAGRLPDIALAVVLLLALAAFASSFVPSENPSFVTEPARRSAIPGQTQSTTAAAPTRHTKHSDARRAAKPKAAPRPAKVRATPPRPKPARKPNAKPRARTLQRAERVLSWHGYPPAAYYVVYLRRGTTTVYEARTKALTATLPARLRLRPGVYRVLVRPAVPVEAGLVFGPALAKKTIKV